MLMRKREGGQPDESSEVDYDLTCWYLNLRRVIELVGAEPFAPYLSAGHSLSQGGDQLHKLAALSTAKNALVEWFRSANPPTLGQLLASGELSNGSIFTHYASFYCKGLPAVRAALEKGKSSVPMAEAYAKLDDLKAGCRLSARFHHEHLTSTSAWHELSGQKQLFTLAVATEVSEDVIDAIPFVIASLFANLLDGNSSSVRSRWQRNLEVFVDAVDSFVRIRDNELRLSVHQLEPLRNLPEEEVKQAFAEIIGEPMIPRDWGGERSDLFSSRVKLDGRRVPTAFVFKGPAKFVPLTMAGLGRNGDQIYRLFSEPADLLVLQHCHTITPPVRAHMRAHAQQIGNPRLFCLVDGYDTIRVLRAYGKCGL